VNTILPAAEIEFVREKFHVTFVMAVIFGPFQEALNTVLFLLEKRQVLQ
jgi:hypothetical protein